jgi:KDO2-lipid IV(A) lauroyltransferase
LSAHALETLLLKATAGTLRRLSPRAALGSGACLGDAVRLLGIRRAVAESNLARALPERSAAERARILRDHYRELGRIAAEYARLPELVAAGPGEVVAEVRGMEHLERAARAGRGVILLTGHFGNFELLGAWLGRRHPVEFVTKPLSNPGAERWIQRQRAASGVGTLSTASGVKGIYASLRANRWVAMVADQDARRAGVFVPFMGRLASTALGPARLALATGAPIVMGFPVRGADGRHVLEIEPPLDPGPETDAAALRLTALHTARLEAWVRRYPAHWFWLHRRWKTAPPVTHD